MRLVVLRPGEEPIPLVIRRISKGSRPNTLQFSGGHLSLFVIDGTLEWRPDLEGFDGHVTMVHPDEATEVALKIEFEALTEEEPRWLIPGVFYNDNKVRDCQRIYPCYSALHRASEQFVSSHWEFRSDRAALAAVFCSTYSLLAFAATEERFGISDDLPRGMGMSGIGFRGDGNNPTLTLRFPYAEGPMKFSYCHPDRTEPVETYIRIERGLGLEARFQFGACKPEESGNAAPWEAAYRALYEERWPESPLKPRLSTIEALQLAVEGLVNWHTDDGQSMIHETAAFDKHFGRRGTNLERMHMHAGWLSGALPGYSLLWYGRDTRDPDMVRLGHGVLDRVTAELSPCGTIWPLFIHGEGYSPGIGPEPGLAHSRTIGEAMLFLLRAIRLELQANTPHPEWFKAVESTLDFIITLQREDGAFPSYWNVETGKAFSYSGCAGMCWIAPLIAADHFHFGRKYKDAALRAAEYYASFVEEDFLYGCVEDLPLVPTCDDGHFATISYMMAFEATRDNRWLDLARRAAMYATTFRVGENRHFDPGTVLHQAGYSSRGADIASVATPVLSIAGLISYPEMLRLSAFLDDRYFENRARETRTYATQAIARTDGAFNARKGMAVGQIFHTDWWQPKGMILSLSNAMAGALVAHAELIERHLNIPLAAMGGDTKSIIEASRSSIVAMTDDVVLPESASARRSRSAIRRPRGDGRPKTGIETPHSAITSKLFEIITSSEESIPAPNIGPAAQAEPGTVPPPSRPPDKPRGFEEAFPRPFTGATKTPLPSRHTPLARDPEEWGLGPVVLDESTATAGPGARSRTGTPPPSDEMTPQGTVPVPPAAPAAPSYAGGLLANLFGDDDVPSVNPDSLRPRTEQATNRLPSLDLEDEAEAGLGAGGRSGDERTSTDKVEIKWKIF